MSKIQGINENVLDSQLDDDKHYDQFISSVTRPLQAPVAQNTNMNPYAYVYIYESRYVPPNACSSCQYELQ